MSAVAPTPEASVTPPPAPSPSPPSPVTEAWGRNIRTDYLLLRVMEIIGGILGHAPGTFRTQSNKPVFSYRSFRTVYAVALLVLVTCIKIYSIAKPPESLGSLDTATHVAELAPFYLDIIFFYLMATFTLVRAPAIKMAFTNTYDMAKITPAPSCTKQILSVFVWILFVIVVITREVHFALLIVSTTCSEVSFHSVAFPCVEIFFKVYMTWLLEIYILVCLNLRERQQQLRMMMKDVITPQQEGFWSLLDVHVIEGVISQHRRFSQQASRFFETMSPSLFVLVASFFINEAFGLHTFLTNMVFIGGILKPIALIEIIFLLSHFLLMFAVCCVTSSLSDQWCGVGQEVTGVPLCRVTDQIRVQLLTFLQQLPDLEPVITAAGFFVISKSLLLSMMNFIAIYLIFIVQFYDANNTNITYGYDNFYYCNTSSASGSLSSNASK